MLLTLVCEISAKQNETLGFQFAKCERLYKQFFPYNIFMKKMYFKNKKSEKLAYLETTTRKDHLLWTFKIILFPVFFPDLSQKKRLLLLTIFFYSFFGPFVLLGLTWKWRETQLLEFIKLTFFLTNLGHLKVRLIVQTSHLALLVVGDRNLEKSSAASRCLMPL